MTNRNERPNSDTESSKPAQELDEASLDSAAGGMFKEPTKHPAKVTVPDLK